MSHSAFVDDQQPYCSADIGRHHDQLDQITFELAEVKS